MNSLAKNKEARIPVCFATDDGYSEPCAVAITSLLLNSPDLKFDIFILDGGISKNNKANLSKIVNFFKSQITFIKIDDERFDSFPLPKGGHFNKVTYYRLMIPSLIKDYNKIIYLDCDVIVKKNIKDLYKKNIAKHYLAAAKQQFSKKNKARLALPKSFNYVNTGVLLFNAKKWRESNIQNKMFDYIKKARPTQLLNVDQDAINYILSKDGDIKLIEQNWNTEFRTDLETLNSYKEIVKNPYIIHYLSGDKPWHDNTRQNTKEYIKYYQLLKKILLNKADYEAVKLLDSDRHILAKINGQNFKLFVDSSSILNSSQVKFEYFSSQILLSRIKNDHTFLDIGAHIGFYSVLVGKKSKNIKIIAIEPIKENYKFLIRNLKHNGVDNYICKNIAASNIKTRKKFFLAESSGSSSFYHPQHSSIKKRIVVDCEPLDNFVKNNKINFIKIDVEGHEIQALEGLKKTFKNNPELEMLIEFNPNAQLAANENPKKLLEKLIDLDFDLYAIYDYPWQNPSYSNESYNETKEIYKVNNSIDRWEEFVNEKYHVNLLCIPKNKSKIVTFFSHSSQLTGAERSMLELIIQLKEKNIFSHVVLPNEGPMQGELEKNNIPYDIVSLNWWANSLKKNQEEISQDWTNSLNNLINFIPKLAKINPDLIYTNTIVCPWGSIVARYLKKPHIWHIREYGNLDHNLKFYFNYQNTIKYIEQNSDSIIVNSKSVLKHISKYLEKNIKKTSVVYNHIDIKNKLINEKISSPFLDKKSLKIIVLGTISQGKNQIEVVKTLINLNKNGINAELLILGANPDKIYFDSLKKITKENEMESKIHILDFVHNPYPYIKASDVLVVPSIKEAFGRTIVEAMLLMKPVVSSSEGGAVELIKNKKTGFIYKLGNTDELEQVLTKLTNERLRDKIAKEALISIKKVNNQKNYGGKIYNIINKTLADHKSNKRKSSVDSQTINSLISLNNGPRYNPSHELQVANNEKEQLSRDLNKIKSSKTYIIWQKYNDIKKYFRKILS